MAGKKGETEDFLAKVQALSRAEGRYAVGAYLFLFEALEFTLKRIGKRRHVSGQELLTGIKDYALANYGAMGRAVFNQWGIHDSKDFGRIVFSLVEAGLMSKTDTDSLADFEHGFDFADVFEKRYVPSPPLRPNKRSPKPPKK